MLHVLFSSLLLSKQDYCQKTKPYIIGTSSINADGQASTWHFSPVHIHIFFFKSNDLVQKSCNSKIRVQNILQKYNSYFYLTLFFVLTIIVLLSPHRVSYN